MDILAQHRRERRFAVVAFVIIIVLLAGARLTLGTPESTDTNIVRVDVQ